jgi:hypothetical protein
MLYLKGKEQDIIMSYDFKTQGKKKDYLTVVLSG